MFLCFKKLLHSKTPRILKFEGFLGTLLRLLAVLISAEAPDYDDRNQDDNPSAVV